MFSNDEKGTFNIAALVNPGPEERCSYPNLLPLKRKKNGIPSQKESMVPC